VPPGFTVASPNPDLVYRKHKTKRKKTSKRQSGESLEHEAT